jgi:vancomycin aglycone glucosyltransferase
MRVLLSTYDSRGGVEPLVGLAVRLRALGAEVRVCAPPDCAERLAEVGVPLVPVGAPVRPLVHGARPPSAADVPRLAAELIAAQFGTLAQAAEGCDALVASGLFPATAGARSVAEKLGGGCDAAARRGQPGKAASVRVNNPGSPGQDPEHENSQTLVT